MDREGPDQAAQMRRMTGAFSVRVCPDLFLHGGAQFILENFFFYNLL